MRLKTTVANAGIGDERTDGALTRLEKDVLAPKPKVVLIMYGTNDSYVDKGATESRLTVEKYRETWFRSLRRFARMARSRSS